MPQLKPNDVEISDEEDAAINAGIALDPDNPEADAEWFKRAKPFREMHSPEECEAMLEMQKRYARHREKEIKELALV